MRLTRRYFTAAAAVALGCPALVNPAHAADAVQFKIGCDAPPDHPLSTRLAEVATAVKQRSGGRLIINVFPNNQLGSDADMLSQLRLGAMELFAAPSLTLSTLVPLSGLPSIGFGLRTYDQVWAAMDGELGELVRGAIRKTGMMPIGKVWDNGFRQITTSSAPINVPADLRGLKLRVPVTPFMVSLFSSLGASPASLGINEVYSALQTHVIDGQENPLAQIETAKLFEVQKTCALSNHCWSGYWILGNRRAMASLPEDLRTMMEQAFDTTAVSQRADLQTMDKSLQASLSAQGLSFTTPDPAPFQAQLKTAGFYAKWQQTFGEDAWKALETYAGKLS